MKYSVFHYVTLLGKWSLNLTEELKCNLLCLTGSLQKFDLTRTFVIPGASAMASDKPQKYLLVLGQCPWRQGLELTCRGVEAVVRTAQANRKEILWDENIIQKLIREIFLTILSILNMF